MLLGIGIIVGFLIGVAVVHGEGDQPGSLKHFSGPHNSIYSSITSLPMELYTQRARKEYETPDTSKFAKEEN